MDTLKNWKARRSGVSISIQHSGGKVTGVEAIEVVGGRLVAFAGDGGRFELEVSTICGQSPSEPQTFGQVYADIADKVVPAYRKPGANYSCTGTIAKAWDAAYKGAKLALGRRPKGARWRLGDLVQKKQGSSWRGRVVGYYRTKNTPLGYAVESLFEPGSVQVWPQVALEDLAPGLSWRADQGVSLP